MKVMHSMYISSFMEKKAQLACHKQEIFIGANSKGLINLKEVLVISFCFYFTLRTMFQFKFGGDGEFKNSKKIFSKIQLLYLLTCFSYFF